MCVDSICFERYLKKFVMGKGVLEMGKGRDGKREDRS